MLFVAAGASAVVVKEDGEAVCKACKEAANEKTDFVWTQLRALGTFLGMRAQHMKQQQAPLQQSQRQGQQSQQPSGSHAMEAQSDRTSRPLQRNHSDAMDQDVAEEVDGAMDIARAKGNGSTGEGDGDDEGSQRDKATHEQAASTKEEHTEEHKVVKTDQDEAGNQQAKAEVVHKTTTTKVKKRKRVEQTSAGSGNGDAAQPGSSLSSADQAVPDASKQSCGDEAGEEVGAQNGHGNGHQDCNSDTGRLHLCCSAPL